MPKRTVFERSRRELSLDVPIVVRILLVVEQSSLETQARGCVKTSILTVLHHTYRKYRSLGTSPRLTFQARLLHNQEDVNTDRYV